MQCVAENMRWKGTGVDSRYVVNLFQQHSDFSVKKKKQKTTISPLKFYFINYVSATRLSLRQKITSINLSTLTKKLG